MQAEVYNHTFKTYRSLVREAVDMANALERLGEREVKLLGLPEVARLGTDALGVTIDRSR